mmetsp:Transcript_11832/g.41454  ORF Transcript_11832/g.41454 Transcript_11832/m.41454 type:complete len:709 (-) Transcript_11832:87-2213(-)
MASVGPAPSTEASEGAGVARGAGGVGADKPAGVVSGHGGGGAGAGAGGAGADAGAFDERGYYRGVDMYDVDPDHLRGEVDMATALLAMDADAAALVAIANRLSLDGGAADLELRQPPKEPAHTGHLGHGSDCASCADLDHRVRAFFALSPRERAKALRVEAADVVAVVRACVSCPGCHSGVNQVLAHPTLHGLLDTVGGGVVTVGAADGGAVGASGDGDGGGCAGGRGGAPGRRRKGSSGGGRRRSRAGTASSAGGGSDDGAASTASLSLCDALAGSRRHVYHAFQQYDLDGWMADAGVNRHARGKSATRKRCSYHVASPSLGYDWQKILQHWDVLDRLMPEVTCIPLEAMDAAIDTLLHVHRFCKECAHNVNIAYHRLVDRPDPVDPLPDDVSYADEMFAPFELGGTFHVPARPGQEEVKAGQEALYVDPGSVCDLIARGERDSRDDEDAVAMGQHPDHRHATTLYQGQMQVLSCVGSVLLQRLLKAQQVHDATRFLHELTLRAAVRAMDGKVRAAVQADTQEELVKQLLEMSGGGGLGGGGGGGGKTGVATAGPATTGKLSKKARKRAARERRAAAASAKTSSVDGDGDRGSSASSSSSPPVKPVAGRAKVAAADLSAGAVEPPAPPAAAEAAAARAPSLPTASLSLAMDSDGGSVGGLDGGAGGVEEMLLQVDEAELRRMKAQRDAHRAQVKARFSEWCKKPQGQ